MKRAILIPVLTALFFGGCGDGKSEAKLMPVDDSSKKVEVKKSHSKDMATEPFKPILAKKSMQNPNINKFYTIFKDGAKIAPEGKPMLLVFGQPTDPYTVKLQNNVVENADLSKKIKEVVTPIYIDATAVKMHKFSHEGKLMDVDTKTLISIYNIHSTPTLIFIDKSGKSIFIVPGYMPPKQFIATLEFVKEGKYEGKDRKKGEVYEALKSFYKANGIKIKEAKK